jgi:hypothetical protein
METIGQQKIWSYFNSAKKAIITGNTQIRKGEGHRARTFMELATKIAELQFMNRDYVLLFRDQSTDHRNVAHNTTLSAGQGRTQP